ncbi:uncharacterized protein G2W53_016380 [Senna tora]|uniref:Uncharacterized protein n=1 Tax=Senna tora TaxID=362788 RepID=A0A834WMY4_9FABA|nr:uncharacterized protein G2W53_016380 [Senna tora]
MFDSWSQGLHPGVSCYLFPIDVEFVLRTRVFSCGRPRRACEHGIFGSVEAAGELLLNSLLGLDAIAESVGNSELIANALSFEGSLYGHNVFKSVKANSELELKLKETNHVIASLAAKLAESHAQMSSLNLDNERLVRLEAKIEWEKFILEDCLEAEGQTLKNHSYCGEGPGLNSP